MIAGLDVNERVGYKQVPSDLELVSFSGSLVVCDEGSQHVCEHEN